MVALHNRRLTARDVWPDGIWSWEDEVRAREEVALELFEEGVTGPEAVFEESRRMSARYAAAPPMRVHQEIMRRISPPAPPRRHVSLTEEELEYLLERLEGVNDPVGAGIREKAVTALKRDV